MSTKSLTCKRKSHSCLPQARGKKSLRKDKQEGLFGWLFAIWRGVRVTVVVRRRYLYTYYTTDNNSSSSIHMIQQTTVQQCSNTVIESHDDYRSKAECWWKGLPDGNRSFSRLEARGPSIRECCWMVSNALSSYISLRALCMYNRAYLVYRFGLQPATSQTDS